jgi:hypothetical protein
LLVSEVDFVVSFVHLECAPFGCVGYLQTPITTNNDAHSRLFHLFSQEITLVYGLAIHLRLAELQAKSGNCRAALREVGAALDLAPATFNALSSAAQVYARCER